MQYTVTQNNIHIQDSAFISKNEMGALLQDIYKFYAQDTEVFFYRSFCSMKNEWAVHNLCFKWGLFRNHTKDVDLNVPNRLEWLYNLLGPIALLLIK